MVERRIDVLFYSVLVSILNGSCVVRVRNDYRLKKTWFSLDRNR